MKADGASGVGGRWRDWAVGLGVGTAVLGFVLLAVLATGRQAAGVNRTAAGTIVAKVARAPAEPAGEVMVGRGGLRAREFAGELVVRVDAENGREYRVPVDAATFGTRRVGERLVFLKPR